MFVYRHRVTFICMKVIQTSKVDSINDKKSIQWSSICCSKTCVIGIIITIVISICCKGFDFMFL